MSGHLEPGEREDFYGTPEDEHRIMLGSREREACPTCRGTGAATAPFDAYCPAAWAHHFLPYIARVPQ